MKKVALLAIAAALIIPSCLVTSCSSRDTTCLPAALEVSHATAKPGTLLQVSAPPAACDLGYADQEVYTLELISENPDAVNSSLQEAKVNEDGSFSSDILIPSNFPLGPASVLVTGSPFDDCKDDKSCAAYTVSFVVE